MTEAEWMGCTDPTPMLEFLRGKASDRKLRLFAVALCRLHRDQAWATAAVAVAERHADALSSTQELAAVRQEEMAWAGTMYRHLEAREVDLGLAWINATTALRPGEAVELALELGEPKQTEAATHLLRCIFGNPFRPPSRLPEEILAWHDATIRLLAEGIYQERAFERLPILADALVDAGCEEKELIEHFRSKETHVRGCWGVDLILGRS